MDTPISAKPPANKIGKKLCEALDGIKADGSFAAFANLLQPALKPIRVHDVGHVTYPLQETTARQLIEKARQAPYGKGSETFVDTSVRNTWELDAAQLDLDPKWGATINVACKWVAHKLGITAPVTAELYKMLIYGKGAMFKPHTDTEKIPGMFGTLVIGLPSAHQGGDLVVKHRDVTKIFKTSETQPSMACWFSDVTHEVLPVTSGIRWVLTFNLAISQQVQRPSAAMNEPGLDGVRNALHAWLESRRPSSTDKEPDHLYYMLDHTYTEANLSLHSLKSADLTRMRCLKDVCDSENVSLFLGVLEKKEHGGCDKDGFDNYGHRRWGYDEDGEDEGEDEYGEEGGNDEWHSFYDVYETDFSIKRLVTTDGQTLRENMELREGDVEKNLIQDYEDPFENAARGEEDYTGFTGNEVCNMPSLSSYEANDSVPLGSLSDTLVPVGGLSPSRLVSPKPPGFNEQLALQFVAAVLEHREYELFGKSLKWFKTKLGAPLFELVRKAAAEDSFDFTKIKDSLAQNLALHAVGNRMQLLTVLGVPSKTPHNTQIIKWAAEEVVPASIEACLGPKATIACGSAIVTMVKEYHDIEYLKTRLIPAIEKQVALTPFALSALMRIVSVFDEAITVELCEPLLRSALDILSVTKLRTKEAAEVEYNASKTRSYSWRDMGTVRNCAHQHPEMYINAELLAHCLARCVQLKWDDLARRLSLKVVSEIAQVPPAEYHYLWIPFVRELISKLDSVDVPLSTPRYQQVALAIFEAYLEKQVGKEPTGEQDYSGQGPRTWQFSAAEKRRRHVEGYVSGLPLRCQCQTHAQGSPYTLIVTKKVDTGAKAKKDWTDRFSQAWDEFSKFDQGKLKVLLGDDFEKITSMRHLRLNQGEGSGKRAPPKGTVDGAQVAGAKRKAEE
ncbi:hypothetical protein QBC40DRAFT_268358 [Triangularia verruculosa]|uniref:Prolyl 4-hydroxylase alpha subunit Fe(2+) 2OG dioxygenase domain-containing protein n=1 Tax=Triangularia verruculosa TaxID=2587418 RepID=A0AAN7AS78_9PEZI|nr:hypothetical protein QBC40DRAFT_268358 [Triangularia verruculosa]